MPGWSAAVRTCHRAKSHWPTRACSFSTSCQSSTRDVLEALRQPLEDGRVAIARVGRAAIFPARFQLVAAMNPCPCGFAGTSDRACRCPRAGSRALPASGVGTAPRPDRPVDRDATSCAIRARRRSRTGGVGDGRRADRRRARVGRGSTTRSPQWTTDRPRPCARPAASDLPAGGRSSGWPRWSGPADAARRGSCVSPGRSPTRGLRRHPR